MHIARLVAASLLISASLPSFAHGRSHRGSASNHGISRRASRVSVKSAGQHYIDDSRAAEIQQALLGAGYLANAPTGHWDASTQTAMQRFQSDNGWQTKVIPDSRAIIKLGLGPHTDAPATTVSSLQ